MTTVYGYDVDSRLTSLRHHRSGADMYNVTYYYDAAGNRTALRNHVRSNHSERYWYDGANRLTSFRRGTMHPTVNTILAWNVLVDPVKTGEEWWELDKRGNWTEYWEMLNDVPYVDDGYSDERTANAANEYTAITPTGASTMTPDYDANGNLTSNGMAENVGSANTNGQRYEYDAANRLTKVYRASDNQLLQEISYDALDRRVETKEYISAADGSVLGTPTRTWHIFAGDSPVTEYAVTDAGGGSFTTAVLRDYAWGQRFPEPVMLVDYTTAGDNPTAGQAEILYHAHNALGSVTNLTSANGQEVERYDYDPYGTTHIEDASSNALTTSNYGNAYAFTGQRYDAITKQYHFKHRTLSPSLGRWLQRDPLVLRASVGSSYRDRDNPFADAVPVAFAGYYDGMNLYAYGRASPLRWRDPMGLQCKCNQDNIACAKAEGVSISTWCSMKDLQEDQLKQYNWPRKLCASYVGGVAYIDLTIYGVTNDKWKHCYIGCRVGSVCGAAAGCLLGTEKEHDDLTDCDSNTHFELEDALATCQGAQRGMQFAPGGWIQGDPCVSDCDGHHPR